MNKLQLWFLKKTADQLVIQGFHHRQRIIKYFSILVNAARNEFTEDNKPTLDCFLKECLQEALDKKI